METNFIQVAEMTYEEKFKMYMKLSKKEIIRMHIEFEWHTHSDTNISIVPYGVTTWPPVNTYPTYATNTSAGKPINMQH